MAVGVYKAVFLVQYRGYGSENRSGLKDRRTLVDIFYTDLIDSRELSFHDEFVRVFIFPHNSCYCPCLFYCTTILMLATVVEGFWSFGPLPLIIMKV